MKISLIVAAALLGAATQAPAATFYKLTDDAGRVTYLDRAPEGFAGKVEVLTVDPDVHTTRLPDAMPADVVPEPPAQLIRGDRVAPGQAADPRVSRAQSDLAMARAALQQAQDHSLAEDWIYFQRGGRAPRPEYAARLQALEADVQTAESNLAEAERQQRLAY